MKLLTLAFTAYVISAAGTQAAADPFAGTWKLNPAKSKYAPGPPPQSAIVKLVPQGDAMSVTSDVEIEGKAYQTSYISKADGTPAKITGSPMADAVAVTRVDERNRSLKYMKDGKVTGEARASLSPDGKTLTVTGSRQNLKGQRVKYTAVYERQ